MPRLSPDNPRSPATLEAGDLATVTMTDHSGVAVATIAGEVDISNVEAVAEILYRLPNQAAGLVVDLTETNYLDSAAISLLHDLATRVGQRSQRLAIVCDRQSLPYRVLTLTDVHSRTPVVDRIPEAIQSVRDEVG
jgi:anti-anti-sigma factor